MQAPGFYEASWQSKENEDRSSERWTASHVLHQALTEKNEPRIEDDDVAQGRILWLPSQEELPEHAIKRAHGKGAIEEGIHNHPVVIVSQPAEEGQTVHFYLITSLQGKRLEQLYAKSNDFHTSRRSWYLPIAPTPDHPDALSKKTKKRFPTLKLANGATLRWNSYVNIRHVYKIDRSLLKAYTNPEAANGQIYRFERESMIRLLAKGKTLTMYEPGPQSQSQDPKESTSEPIPVSALISRTAEEAVNEIKPSESDTASVFFSMTSTLSRVDFRTAEINAYRIASPLPKVPPDAEMKSTITPSMHDIIVRPFDHFFGSIQSMAVTASERSLVIFFDPIAIKKPLTRIWVDLKGVTAIAIASI